MSLRRSVGLASLSAFVAALATSACGQDGATAGDRDGGATFDAAPGADAFVAPPGSFSVDWGNVAVAPGVERTQCVTVRVGNDAPIRVNTIHNDLVAGSHHLIVYKVNDTEERATPYDCQPFVDTLDPSKGAPIMVTQKHSDTITLPRGVGYSFAAGQMVRLEMHYINTTDGTLEVGARTTFVPMPEAEFEHEAGFLFIGTPDIYIGPGGAPTLGPIYFPLPEVYGDVTFYALTGHTHQYGLDVRISTASSETDPGTPVYAYDDWNWAEPATATFPQGFTIPSGGGFKFSCAYDNTSGQTVTFGESANDEMCFFWAYYYPDKGAKVCFHTDFDGGHDVCCPGSEICSQIGF